MEKTSRSSWPADLTPEVVDAIIRVHQVLGPGFLEGVYQRALMIELDKRCLSIEKEKEIEVSYDGQPVGRHRLDIVVGGRVIIELKTVESLGKAHYAQVRSYLKATGLPVAILVNFSTDKADIRRIENQ